MQSGICGIDFGTSNSAISVVTDGKAKLVPIDGAHVTTPSAVFFNFEDKRISYGRQATEEYLDGFEGRLLRSLKSVLGSSLIDESTSIGARRMDFRDIIGLFIAHLKKQAELQSGAVLEKAVIGRPVRFVDDDDRADRKAEDELRRIASAQGFEEVDFEFEPLAAARNYEMTLTREEAVLVVDIGGGTSDFSVLRLSPKTCIADKRKRDILANSGIHIGGTDFDKNFNLHTVLRDMGHQTILKSGLPMPMHYHHQMATWHLINFLYTQKSIAGIKTLIYESADRKPMQRFLNVVEQRRGHELADRIESAKIALTEKRQAVLDLQMIEDGWIKKLTQIDLLRSIEADVQKIVDTARNTVTHLAGIAPDKIDTVFLTGDSTGLPGFEVLIQKAFPKSRLHRGDRFSSVASGLGLAALERFG